MGSQTTTTRDDVLDAVGRLYADGPWFARTLQRCRPYICPFEELVDRVPAGSTVFDIGCGAGLFLMLLAVRERGIQGLGIDISEPAIALAEQARRRLPHPQRLKFVVDRDDNMWPSATFDVVSMIDVLHHLPPSKQPELLHKAASAVRPGGLLLFKDIGERPRWKATANRMHDLVLARQWIHYFPLSRVLTEARGAGLQLLETHRVDRLWYSHELALFRRALPGA
jgi:cyclopropane fatty-acyl-phospholipid synthase-like methyltransferase